MAGTNVMVVQEGAYLTYPHASGFYENGRSLVVGELSGESCRLLAVPLVGVGDHELCLIEEHPAAYFDIARKRDLLAGVWNNALWLIDMRGAPRPERLYAPPRAARLQPYVNISAQGDLVIVGEEAQKQWSCVSVDTRMGRPRTLFQHDWPANHFHFCPHDEAWIGYCHEGPADAISDRVWAWHSALAPEGRCIFDQRVEGPGAFLHMGCPRWAHHDTCALDIAYGTSPTDPRGLWQIWPDDRPPRMISAGNRDRHCDISPDGRWAVVDTNGPYDRPGRGREDSQGVSDILLVSMDTGIRTLLARTGMAHHPHHPHPVFTPDSRHVLFNHTAVVRGSVRPCVVMVDVPY